jgi:hypothetical protein
MTPLCFKKVPRGTEEVRNCERKSEKYGEQIFIGTQRKMTNQRANCFAKFVDWGELASSIGKEMCW